MIAKLTGQVDSLGDGWAVVDVGGVGYLVFCSSRTLAMLAIGSAAILFVETHVREDHIHLYGFMDDGERNWFKLLTTVQGVGAKVAMSILSALSIHELAHAVAAGDQASITRAAGVGPKLAVRIASELKDKVPAATAQPLAMAGGDDETVHSAAAGTMADAISALVNLGYGLSEARAVLARVSAGMKPGFGVAALIRAGLSELGPREHVR